MPVCGWVGGGGGGGEKKHLFDCVWWLFGRLRFGVIVFCGKWNVMDSSKSEWPWRLSANPIS